MESMRGRISEVNKQVFGFIDNICNTFEDDTVLSKAQLHNTWTAYCKAKRMSEHMNLLNRTIEALELPYFRKEVTNERTIYHYSAANHRIVVCRSLSSEQEQLIYDLAVQYHSMGILPFFLHNGRGTATNTVFGYPAVVPDDYTEYKGYALDHMTLDIDNDLVLVCTNKQNGKIVRFRIAL